MKNINTSFCLKIIFCLKKDEYISKKPQLHLSAGFSGHNLEIYYSGIFLFRNDIKPLVYLEQIDQEKVCSGYIDLKQVFYNVMSEQDVDNFLTSIYN